MKNILKRTFILSIILCIFITVPSFAENINNNINLYIKENFKKDVYKPGDSDDLKFVLENNKDENIKIKSLYFSKRDNVLSDNFEEIAKNTNIIIKNNNKIIVESLLEDLLDSSKHELNIEAGPHKSLEFDMYINIDSNMGNEAQNIYQELYINTNYEIHNKYGYINNNSQANSGENDDKFMSEIILPNTGEENNYYVLTICIMTLILAFIYRKEIGKLKDEENR